MPEHHIQSSGKNPTLWTETASVPLFAPLGKDAHADVCVIGGGIAGLSTAYQLLNEGKSVVVLEDGSIGSGETGRTSAHLSNALDDHYFNLEKWHGPEGARWAAQSHSSAIAWIQQTVMQEKIDCDFRHVDGYLFNAPGQSQDLLQRELEAAHRAGLRDVSWVDRVPWRSFDTGPALCFPYQAQFHPLRYLIGLAQAVQRRGGRIHTVTHAQVIEGGSPARVVTSRGFEVICAAVVVATNSPIIDRVAIHTKQAAYRTYIVGARIPAGLIPQALYWDTADPYHYARLQSSPHGRNEETLIVGGEDHKTGQADDADKRYARLEAWVRERFPMVNGFEYRWSGQVVEPVDGMAFIGRNPGDEDNLFIATGDSGNGLTHGTIAAMLLGDLIAGRANAWAKLYDPSRKPSWKTVPEYVRENMNVLPQYADHLTPGETNDVQRVARGSGAVMRRGLEKVAAYRDEQGRIWECSAVCPHLGCVVDWNSNEKTWDCPCHGSRFDPYGKVVNGPANQPLNPLRAPASATPGSRTQ